MPRMAGLYQSSSIARKLTPDTNPTGIEINPQKSEPPRDFFGGIESRLHQKHDLISSFIASMKQYVGA